MVYHKKCCYKNCTSSTRTSSPKIKYFPFPKCKTKLTECKNWIAACGRTDLTPEQIKKTHYVCSRHFFEEKGQSENFVPIPNFGVSDIQGYDGAYPLDLSKPTAKTVIKSKLEKPKLYYAQNFKISDFSVKFFEEHGPELTEKACKLLANIKFDEEIDSCVIKVKDYLVINPKELILSPALINAISSISDKNIKDKASFKIHTRVLKSSVNTKIEMMNCFKGIEGYDDLNSFGKELIANNWLRRFIDEVFLMWVNLKPDLAVPKLLEPRKYLTPLEETAKVEKVVHHIGGFIMRKIINKFKEPRLFENAILKIGLGDSKIKIADYASWSEKISRGGLITLTPKGFEFFKYIHNQTEPIFKDSILGNKVMTKDKVMTRLNKTDVTARWNNLWGDDDTSQRGKAFDILCDTFANCRGVALRSFNQRKYNNLKRKDCAERKGVRQGMKKNCSDSGLYDNK